MIVPPSYKAAAPITTRTEFEIFAEDEAGHSLPVFGRKLFDEAPTTFAPLDRIPVPANYVLGPGDELLIHVWGKIDLDTRATVDRNGQIFVPTIGALTVAGLPYEQLQSFLRSAFAKLYKDFDLNVTLGQLRSIQVFVLGSARQPGVYTISSLSTLVNALFASGGPSATGTMRHIQLRRDISFNSCMALTVAVIPSQLWRSLSRQKGKPGRLALRRAVSPASFWSFPACCWSCFSSTT